MSETTVRDIFLGILVFVGLGLGLTSIMGEMLVKAPSPSNPEKWQALNNSIQIYNNLSDSIYGMSGSISNSSADANKGTSFLDIVIGTAWNMLIKLPSILGFFTNSITLVLNQLDIPYWITGLILMAVIVIIIFSILSIVFGKAV
jgi:hypothetical protein